MARQIISRAMLLPFQPCSRCSTYRFFSSTVARRKEPPSVLTSSQRADRSISGKMKEATAEAARLGNIPSDFGFIPGTFVTPAADKRPPIFSSPRARVRFEFMRLQRRVTDFIQLVAYCKIQTPRMRLLIRQKVPTALVLYRQMYTAFAAGDMVTIRKICADGLREKLQSRIKARGDERVQWEFHGFTGRSKVVSSRGANVGNGLGLRQAVIRIRSRQSLTRYKADGTSYPGTGEVKEVEEYVVIQKQKFVNREGPWMMWGTTEPSTPESVSSNP